MKSLVAVVTPVYNGEDTIEKSILSLISQTFDNWISIIINDGSSDNTKEILRKYEDDERFLIIHLAENKGRGYARNLGLLKIKELGVPYMCMLDADDWYAEHKLDLQFRLMEQERHLSLISSSLGIVDEGGLYSVIENMRCKNDCYYKDSMQYQPIPHASSILRVADIDISFDNNLKVGEDQDFLMRFLLNKNYRFHPEILYYYRRDQSFSISKYRKSLRSDIIRFEKAGIPQFGLLKMKMINSLKLMFIIVIYYTGMKKIFLTMSGRKPESSERINYEQSLKCTIN